MKSRKGIFLLFLLSAALGGSAQTGDSSGPNKIRYDIRIDPKDWSWHIRIQNLSRVTPVRLLKPGFQSPSTYWTMYDSANKEITRTCLSIDHKWPKGYDPYLSIPPGGEERLDAKPYETLDKLFCRIDSTDYLEFTCKSASGLQFHSGLLPVASKDGAIVYTIDLSF